MRAFHLPPAVFKLNFNYITFPVDFLAKMNVMDYSLLIGVDAESQEITIGIVDFLRSYTLDKHIESWVKLLGGAGEKPTVISPIEYPDGLACSI